MTKAEFLSTLRSQLAGEVSLAELDNTMRYYEEYISDALRGGKMESEILQELGSPLLIAKTIIETAGKDVDGPGNVYEQKYDNSERRNEDKVTYRHYNMNTLTFKLVAAAIIIIVLLVVFTILRVLIPLLIPVIIIGLILSIIRGGRRR